MKVANRKPCYNKMSNSKKITKTHPQKFKKKTVKKFELTELDKMTVLLAFTFL